MSTTKAGLLLGKRRDTDQNLYLPQPVINRHVSLVGQTGSGKTVGLKVFIEEAALQGIPSVVIDPQGDLAQMMLPMTFSEGLVDDERSRAERFWDTVEIRVWTPVRTKGLPLCLDPFVPPPQDLDSEQRIASFDLMAAGFSSIAGFDLSKPEGVEIKSYLVSLLDLADRSGQLPKGFHELASFVEEPERLLPTSGLSGLDFETRIVNLVTKSSREKLSRRLRGQETGVNHLLFSLGTPLDYDLMTTPCQNGKTPVNIVYLNTLNSEDLKQNFLLEVGRRLYDWMIQQTPKGDETKLAFVIDEVQTYIPPYPKNPPAKSILEMLAKQGRKYGLSCMFATQNLASVDYKIFGQSQTLCIGQFTRPQDIKNVKDLLSVGNSRNTRLADELPKLNPGSFQIVCNAAFEHPQQVKFRWLYTVHQSGTLTEDDVEQHTPVSVRECIATIRSNTIPSSKEAQVVTISSTDQEATHTKAPEVGGEIESRQRPGRSKYGEGFQTDVDLFEVHQFRGLSVLRDQSDPLSVMYALTNLATSVVLAACVLFMINEMLAGTNIHPLGVFLLLGCIPGCAFSIAGVLAPNEHGWVHFVHANASRMQYLTTLWIWFMWFAVNSKTIDAPALLTPLIVIQTLLSAFILLELGHRLKIGNIRMPQGETLSSFFGDGMNSVKVAITTTQLDHLRASSSELFNDLRLVLDVVVILTLLAIIHPITLLSSLNQDSWIFRIVSVYAILLLSQVIVRRNSNVPK